MTHSSSQRPGGSLGTTRSLTESRRFHQVGVKNCYPQNSLRVYFRMSNFRRFEHLTRLEEDDDLSEVMVFPKLDGTNASVWSGGCGSRNRLLSLESDNAGFCAWVNGGMGGVAGRREWLDAHPDIILYGEWLVPHTIKDYREDAWRRFYVFDVFRRDVGSLSWSSPEWTTVRLLFDYCDLLEHRIGMTRDRLIWLMENQTVLMKDGCGPGEGLVLWLPGGVRRKLVRNEFKEKNRRLFDAGKDAVAGGVEAGIAAELSEVLVRKTAAKVLVDLGVGVDGVGAVRGRAIPQLLSRVWHDFITEEFWDVLKERRNGVVVDFRLLHGLIVRRIKEIMHEWF